MNFTQYQDYHHGILARDEAARPAPYDNPDYFDYTRMNWQRSARWLKTGVLNDETLAAAASIRSPQKWIVITEPWCGDAAHIVPFLYLIAQTNPLIQIVFELRDQEPFRIDQYLTRGGRSIPKLIIRDEHDHDLATWGPRPAGCQEIYDRLMEEKADFETVKTALQNWYNADKGTEIQREISRLILSALPA